MSTELLTPILKGGARNIHFFEGRVLTAQDLREQQTADRLHRRQLGRAIGAGVVEGLEVILAADGADGSSPALTISQGLALNGQGQTLELAEEQTVTLIRPSKPVAPDAGLFADCRPPTVTQLPVGDGVYILVMSPASGFSERAPKIGLETAGKAVGCGSRYAVDGVQFRLELVPLDALSDIDNERLALAAVDNTITDTEYAPILSRFRNVLANLCLRAVSAAGHRAQIRSNETPAFQAPAPALSTLGTELSECDLLLALFYWDGGGIRFVDNWAVRRLARWFPQPEVISLFPVYGLERLLQFLAHLDDLLIAPLQPSQHRIENFFRFIPPVAYFPVSGVGSPRGLSSSRFLTAFTSGAVDSLAAGMLAMIFERSMRFTATDLTAKPYFQVYEIEENTAAVLAGATNQRFQVYVSRDLNGPLSVGDGVTTAFENAWEVYRGLIKRRVFLPVGSSPEQIAAQITIVQALRDVLEIANRQAARSAAWGLDLTAALAAFRTMYELQKELTTLLLSDIPGIDSSQNPQNFAETVNIYLDNDLPDGTAGLLAAIEAANLCQTVEAQTTINRFVGQWSGEGVAVGPFTLRYLSSPQGTVLVPEQAEPFPHLFQLSNRTDKRLTFFLETLVSAPSGDWQGAASIHNTLGNEIDRLALPVGGQATVTVRVAAPADAEVGETASLMLTARVAPPTDRSVTEFLDLDIGADSGEPVLRSVRFVGPPLTPDGGLNVVTSPGGVLTYGFNLTYTAAEEPLQADFDFIVELTAANPDIWNVGIMTPSPAPRPSPNLFSQTITLSSNTQRQISVFVAAPSAGGESASFTVRVNSVDLDPAISNQRDETFNVST